LGEEEEEEGEEETQPWRCEEVKKGAFSLTSTRIICKHLAILIFTRAHTLSA
jgi:hypothetical protein